MLRLIEVVRRELGADDARFELGGRDPEDGRLVWISLPHGYRAVAVFREAPPRREHLEEKLRLLLASFSGIGADVGSPAPSYRPPAQAQHDLDDVLAALAERAGAIRALVIDDRSPMVWGSSESPRGADDVDALLFASAVDARARELGLDLAELLTLPVEDATRRLGAAAPDRAGPPLLRELHRLRGNPGRAGIDAWRVHLEVARAVAAVRAEGGPAHRLVAREPGFGFLSRTFATIYRLVLVFEGELSELHAEAAMVHALPVVEKLLLAVPPVDPSPRGGELLPWRGPGSGKR